MAGLLAVAINNSCSNKGETVVQQQRSFYMGTTPWPADFTLAEVEKMYGFINDHCDIVSHHFDEGVPYEEAFNKTTMPASLLDNVQTRVTRTAPAKKVFLSVAPLAIDRLSKAPYYRNTGTDSTIKSYWAQLSFDNAKVITAYVNYISWLVEKFQPVYVNYGVESNSQLWDAAGFTKYKSFLSQVYSQVKTKYPGIPFFISFMVDESAQGLNYATQLAQYSDFIGLSAYPYIVASSASAGNTDPQNFRADFFTRFINIAPNKPLAFAETGYIAQDLSVPAYSLTRQGNTTWQNAYLQKVLQLCNEKKAKLFIWFCPKDYDKLLITFQNQGAATQAELDLMSLWRDTGLSDENDIKRPAYESWLSWMSKERKE